MKIEMAKSLSGHDKEKIYVIAKEEGEIVYLVNGENRTLEQPKKKNRKHIQVIKKLPTEITDCFSKGLTDLAIKRAIKLYEKNMSKVN